MTSFVSSILHNSANKIESMSLLGSKHSNSHHRNKTKGKHNNQSQARQQQPSNLGSRLAMHASTPILTSTNNNNGNAGYYYHQPQMSYSAEYVPAPPPYDQQQQQLQQLQQQLQQQQQQQQQMQLHSPTPTPSTSWTSEMSALAEKIKDDVTSTFKGVNSSKQQQAAPLSNIDRHSISQGMKLVSIAADEYEEGNESVALDIYLTGVDKILMALPNKTDMSTKMAIREKLQSVEERVGILNIATTQKKIYQQKQQSEQDNGALPSSVINSFILSRIASTISTISSKAYQSATAGSSEIEILATDGGVAVASSISEGSIITSSATTMPTIYIEGGDDSMTKFKRFGQYVIDVTVAFAVLIKQSPLPDIVCFLFSYLIQLFVWVDAQYHINQKAQNFGIQCIKFGLQADEQYRLHEYLSEGLYMLVAAGLKAAVAFRETPGYDNNLNKYQQQQQHIRNRSEPPVITPTVSSSVKKDDIVRRNSDCSISTTTSQILCSPTAPEQTRSSFWVWTPWQ